MHRHSLAPIDTARRLLATERDQLHAEREAFRAFGERVESLEATPAAATPSPATRSLAATTTSAVAGDVRRAYRETVLAVDHYGEVYGESPATNAHNELGPDIAARLDGEGPVTAAFLDVLGTTVEQSIAERGRLLSHLDAEAASLEEAHDALATVAATLSDRSWSCGDDATEDPGERCESVVRSRQSLIQERHISPLVDGHDLCTYLYGSADGDWTYPVLSVAATLQQDIEASRRRELPVD